MRWFLAPTFIRDELDGFGGSDPGRGDTPEADVLAAVSVLAQLPVRGGLVRAYIPGSWFHSVSISGTRLVGGNLSGVRTDSVGNRPLGGRSAPCSTR